MRIPQGHPGVEADLWFADDQCVVEEPRIEHRVRNLQQILTENGVRTERNLARRLAGAGEPVVGLEPLPLLVNETEQGDGRNTNQCRKQQKTNKKRIGGSIENIALLQCEQSLVL